MSSIKPAPRFSSFRPKPELHGQPLQERSVEKDVQASSSLKRRSMSAKGRGRHRKDERVQSTHRGTQSHRHLRERSRSKSPRADRHLKPHHSSYQYERQNDDNFFVDRKGDPKNIEFGSVHRFDVPRFRRCGYGCVLGLRRSYRIERMTANESYGIIVVENQGRQTGQEKYVFSRIEKLGEEPLLVGHGVKSGQLDVDQQNDFVEFEPESRHRLRRKSSELSDDAEDNYRSIHGMVETRPP